MRKILVSGAAALLMVAASYGAANADTLISTNGGDGHLGTPGPGYDFEIVGSDNGVGESLTSYSAIAPITAKFHFDWSYTTEDCCGSFWDPAGYSVNGVETQLAGLAAPYLDDGATYTGAFNVALNAGDTFAFYVDSRDSIEGPGIIEFTSGSIAVPEPATWALMMAGIAMVGGGLRYRRSRSMPALVG